MEACYINGLGCVSAQHTIDKNQFLDDIISYHETILSSINPNYKEYIPPAAARRMAKGIKMGVVASSLALQEAEITIPDAIISGTGFGCLKDSEKFLSTIVDNDEEYLTPTAFIQSTHNTVGAQIALGLQCKAYNFTYVHAAVSFESCLIDAQLKFYEKEATNILVGGVDEVGEHTYKLHALINHIKKDKVNTFDLKNSNSVGTIFGEGASFFSLSNVKQKSTYAQLTDVEIISQLTLEKLNERIEAFLKKNQFSYKDIDAVVLGVNGDVDYDHFYEHLQTGVFKQTQQLYYKHLCGEYNTASSFGFWLAAKLIKHQQVPEAIKLNNISAKSFKNVLLYNQYRGGNHSFILLQSC